jgi:hypothetical protein
VTNGVEDDIKQRGKAWPTPTDADDVGCSSYSSTGCSSFSSNQRLLHPFAVLRTCIPLGERTDRACACRGNLQAGHCNHIGGMLTTGHALAEATYRQALSVPAALHYLMPHMSWAASEDGEQDAEGLDNEDSGRVFASLPHPRILPLRTL